MEIKEATTRIQIYLHFMIFLNIFKHKHFLKRTIKTTIDFDQFKPL